MSSKHTPGPWMVSESSTHVRIVGADGENIWHEDKRCPRVMHDASLIAAAPELLETLQRLVDAVDPESTGWSEAVAAIAKATGAA